MFSLAKNEITKRIQDYALWFTAMFANDVNKNIKVLGYNTYKKNWKTSHNNVVRHDGGRVSIE